MLIMSSGVDLLSFVLLMRDQLSFIGSLPRSTRLRPLDDVKIRGEGYARDFASTVFIYDITISVKMAMLIPGSQNGALGHNNHTGLLLINF